MKPPLLVLEIAVAIHAGFDRAGLPHALGGALALGYHTSEPRGTRDVDVNVSIDPDQPQRMFDVLPSGVRWSSADVAQARRDGQVRLFWPVGVGDGPPIPVDLFLPQHDLHAVVAERAECVPMLDTWVPILSATDLAIFKALFDRPKDWVDIEAMLRFGKVDEAEVARWLTAVVGPDDERLAHLDTISQGARQPATDVPVAAVLFGRRKPRLGD